MRLQLRRGAPGRNDDEEFGIWNLEFRIWNCLRCQVDDGGAEGVQIADAQQPRPAWGDHRSCGGRSAAWISMRALAASMRAPAAADEAFHARVMSPASAASRRIWAAFADSCTALTSRACAATSSSGG